MRTEPFNKRYCLFFCVFLFGSLCLSCSRAPLAPSPSSEPTAENDPSPFFRDVTAEAGVHFTFRNGEEANHYAILEVIGGGLAAFDFDGDGRLDLFITGGGYYDGPDKQQIKGHPCKLYRNVSAAGAIRFEDATAAMGLDKIDFYSHGAAAGDFDNDGWPDLLVTGWQRLALFHNEPVDPRDASKGRKFVEVTAQAGLPRGLWTTSAAWGDLDGDGYADLYICQYVDWSFQNHPTDCIHDGKTRDICPPTRFKGLGHKLFRNRGDGTFADASKSAGLRVARTEADYAQLDWLDERARNQLHQVASNEFSGFGSGLGVLLVDINGDGKPDIYVTNDMRDNFLYVNRTRRASKIQLEERGVESGTARNMGGTPDASMGVDAADYNGSGRPSLWVTNYATELHALYRNDCRDGRVLFSHRSIPAGIAAADQNTVAWGTGFVDLEHRGWEDIFLTAGDAFLRSTTLPRAQQAVLFRNQGNGKFVRNSAYGGPYFQTAHVGRGVVLADFDNDGRLDLAISYLNEAVTLLHNEADTGGHHWFGVQLQGANHRDVVGAKVLLEAGGRTQTRFAKGGGSYLSSGDRRFVFGLAATEQIDRLRVVWPSGRQQEWKGLASDRYWRLTQDQPGASPLYVNK